MRRRQLLAAGAAATSLAGCLDGIGGPSAGGSSGKPNLPTPAGRCGSAEDPLSDHLVDDGGGSPYCYEGAKASLAIENERGAEVGVRVEITSNREAVFERSYTLAPDERVVERRVLPAHDPHAASVTIDGEETATGEWNDTSCFRHGVAITAEGIEFGLVQPLSGPGDTQHDCYAGDEAAITIYNSEEPTTTSLYVVDHCSETVHERTLSLGPDVAEGFSDLIVNGGIYDVIVAVDDENAAEYRFYNECWGVTAGIAPDGSVSIRQILIY